MGAGARTTALGAQAEARKGAGRGLAGAGHWGARRVARHGRAGEPGARGSRRKGSQAGARHKPGRAAGPAGCALGALSLFLTRFDSVLFLSQFLDIVREPGS